MAWAGGVREDPTPPAGSPGQERERLEKQLLQTQTLLQQREAELQALHRSCLLKLAHSSWVGRVLRSSTGSVEVSLRPGPAPCLPHPLPGPARTSPQRANLPGPGLCFPGGSGLPPSGCLWVGTWDREAAGALGSGSPDAQPVYQPQVLVRLKGGGPPCPPPVPAGLRSLLQVVTAETLVDPSDSSEDDEPSPSGSPTGLREARARRLSPSGQGFRLEDVDWNTIAHRYPNLLANIKSNSDYK